MVLPASFELLRDLVYNIIYTRTYMQVLNSHSPIPSLSDPQLSKTNT